MSARKAAIITAVLAQLVCTALATAQAGAAHSGGMDMDRAIRTFVLVNQLELQTNVAQRPVNFEVLSWFGGDYRRLYVRAQGEQPTSVARGGELQGDVMFGRLISPFWTAVAGVRVDTRPRAQLQNAAEGAVVAGSAINRRVTRGMLAIGFVGLAPGWLEVEPTLFVSENGDVSAEVESSIDLLLTQRLILQPRAEINAAVQSVREFGIASGINDVEFEARLRYEISRKFAPYLGVSWTRRTGGTAVLARSMGEPLSVGALSVGFRVWR